MYSRDLEKRLAYVIRRWWPLILLAGIIDGGIAFAVVRGSALQYEARTTLVVGSNVRSSNPNPEAARVSQALANFYAELARRTPVTMKVVEQLGLPFDAAFLTEHVLTTQVMPDTQMIEIVVLDTNRDRAARIANAVADELVKFTPTSAEEIERQRGFVQDQLRDLQTKLAQTDERIEELRGTIPNLTSAGEIAEARQRLQELETIKSTDQATYNNLLANIDAGSTNTLAVLERAVPPAKPLSRHLMMITIVTTLLGLGIGLGCAWLLEVLDDRWRRKRSPEFVLGERPIGIADIEGPSLVTSAALQHPRGQQCQALRSAVLLQLPTGTRRSVILTSARASRARSRLTGDLARVFAYSGQQTLLVDANLGEDYVAAEFGLAGDGMRLLLRDPDQPAGALAQPTELPNLHVLLDDVARQTLVLESTQRSKYLVPTMNWSRAAQTIGQAAELVLFDGPPVLESADAAFLAQYVDGVVLVIDPRTERCSETARALARLRALEIHVLGVVLLQAEQRTFRSLLRWRLPSRRLQPQSTDPTVLSGRSAPGKLGR